MRSPIPAVLIVALSAALGVSAIWNPNDEVTKWDPPRWNPALRNNTEYERLCTNKTSPDLPGPAVFSSDKCRPVQLGHTEKNPDELPCKGFGCRQNDEAKRDVENEGSKTATHTWIGISAVAVLASGAILA